MLSLLLTELTADAMRASFLMRHVAVRVLGRQVGDLAGAWLVIDHVKAAFSRGPVRRSEKDTSCN
jgi:hypothetical protein